MMRTTCNRSILLLCAALAVGCLGQEGTADAPGVTERDSAGVLIVHNTAPAWPDSPRRLDPQAVLSLGREEAGPEQFGYVSHASFRSDGGVLVSDLTAREIRLFDPTGSHLLTLGSPGEGPGEFGGPGMPFLYRGDSIAVFDQRLRRTTIFSTGSDDHRTIPNEMDGNFVVFGSTGGGQLLYFNLGRGYRPDLEPGLQWDTTDVYLASPDGSASVISRRASRQQVVLPDGNTDILIPAHGSIQGATNAGFFWGTTERYEVRLYDLGGTLRRIVRRPVEPTDVDESMVDAYIEYQLDRVRRYEGEEAVPRYRERYENGTYNEKVPIFGRAFLDREGRLWISQSTWPELRASPRSWSVFSPEGRWLGDVESLQGLLLLDSVGDRVLGIWSDEFDVPHVRVHRIVN